MIFVCKNWSLLGQHEYVINLLGAKVLGSLRWVEVNVKNGIKSPKNIYKDLPWIFQEDCETEWE